MTCEIITSRRAVFAVWGEPNTDSIDSIIKAFKDTCEKWATPITYVARVPANAPAPSAAVRRHLNTVLPPAMPYISTYHVVVEGDGFVAAFKRGVLVGLSQLTQRRGTFFFHAHVDDVVRTVSRSAQGDVRELLSLAAAQGLLLGDACAVEHSSSSYPAAPSQFPAPSSRFPGALQILRHLPSRSADGP